MKRVMDQLFRESRLLAVMPHPDDETFACGGTIARAKATGAQVFVMIMSAGDLQQYHASQAAGAGGASNSPAPGLAAARPRPLGHASEAGHPPLLVSGSQRAAELEGAMSALEVDAYTIVYREAERHLRLDALPRRELIAQIERESELAIDRVCPDIVILPAPSYNQDHEATFAAGFAACRPHLPSEKSFVPVVLSADAPQLGWSVEPTRFSVYVDISDYLDRKLLAHACHRSQLRPEPSHASLENIERLARLRGSEVSLPAAEAFVCHRLLI
jgi:LmbE family N-acetylglucosaminyl deacetylase